MRTKLPLYIAISAVGVGGGLWLLRSSKPSATASTSSAVAKNTGASIAYHDGTYTGSIISSDYGDVQVSAIINGSKLTDIQFLVMPSDGHSGEVTQFAESQLRSEAIQAQSAQVDAVSGATSTTDAFEQSLQVALTKASAS